MDPCELELPNQADCCPHALAADRMINKIDLIVFSKKKNKGLLLVVIPAISLFLALRLPSYTRPSPTNFRIWFDRRPSGQI